MTDHQNEEEIKLRGFVLKVSVIIESTILIIIYFSSAEQLNNKKSKRLELKNCTFHQKIKNAKDSLSDFHPDLIIKYQNLFDEIEKFKIIRNKIAHCAIRFKKDVEEFEIWDVTEDENKFQFYSPIIYKSTEIKQQLSEILNKTIPHLANLANEVKSRLKISDPHVYAALEQEDNSDLSM